MSDVVLGEPVFYFEWDADHHVQYDAYVRTIPADGNHVKVHLRVEQEDLPGGFKNVNNIENTEFFGNTPNLDGQDYWLRRFGNWEP